MRTALRRANGARPARFLGDVQTQLRREHVTFLAAGLAYYGILALVPGLIALVSIYGLVADASDVATLIDNIGEAAPEEVVTFLQSQLTDIVTAPSGGLGFGVAVSLLAALWAASAGTKALIRGVNIAFGTSEPRSTLRLRLMSYGITIGLVGFVGAALFLVGIGSAVLGGGAMAWARWPLMMVVTVGGLTTLYRFAPSAGRPAWAAAAVGSTVAAAGWLAASFALSTYVERLGSFNETYGTLGVVVVTLLWLFVSALVVLTGAVVAAVRDSEQARPHL
jgi:membrane protein